LLGENPMKDGLAITASDTLDSVGSSPLYPSCGCAISIVRLVYPRLPFLFGKSLDTSNGIYLTETEKGVGNVFVRDNQQIVLK
jgi:hypothetical protein